MKKIGYVPIFLALAACAVGDPNYPAHWAPLAPPPAADCRHFAGTYSDEGETPDKFQKASFTRELFGYRRGWDEATRLTFALPADDVLEVTVWSEEGELFTRRLLASAGDFACNEGRLTIRSKRWVTEELLATRENVTLELHAENGYLTARVHEFSYALAFLVVPFIADAVHWFRFARLPAAASR